MSGSAGSSLISPPKPFAVKYIRGAWGLNYSGEERENIEEFLKHLRFDTAYWNSEGPQQLLRPTTTTGVDARQGRRIQTGLEVQIGHGCDQWIGWVRCHQRNRAIAKGGKTARYERVRKRAEFSAKESIKVECEGHNVAPEEQVLDLVDRILVDQPANPGPTRLIEHKIRTTSDESVSHKQRRMRASATYSREMERRWCDRGERIGL